MPKKSKKDSDESCLEEINEIENNVIEVIDDKKESLLILATLGATKEYLGEELDVVKIHKMKNKDLEKYFNRYKIVQGKKVSAVLKSKGIKLGIKMISYFLPIDDQESLITDLENDELVSNEISNALGLLILKGGRAIALASGLIQIANHVNLNPAKQLVIDYGDLDNKSEDVI